jgi:hypothetical protein
LGGGEGKPDVGVCGECIYVGGFPLYYFLCCYISYVEGSYLKSTEVFAQDWNCGIVFPEITTAPTETRSRHQENGVSDNDHRGRSVEREVRTLMINVLKVIGDYSNHFHCSSVDDQ